MRKIILKALCAVLCAALLLTGCSLGKTPGNAGTSSPEGDSDTDGGDAGGEIKSDMYAVSAFDGVGRYVKGIDPKGTARKDKYIGIFYFLWIGEQGTDGPYDISKVIEQNPNAIYDFNDPLWGPANAFHFWAEPLFGYYFVKDEYILRKHCEMLTMAGVDFLVFDVTNGYTYEPVYMKLLSVFDEYYKKGWNVPKVAFYTNTNSGRTIQGLYESLYKPGLYKDLWFYLDGKPLIIGKPDECSDEIKDFFTIKVTQWPTEKKKENGFPWIDFHRPQEVYTDSNGNKDIISVSVAQHPKFPFSRTAFYGVEGNWGRSFHDGKQDTSEGAINYGYNFQEQWDFALKEDPRIIFITSWNEWIAQKLDWGALPLPKPVDGPIAFVDSATAEFSRDVEPMKGGHGDNYYLQMIDNIAKFKASKDAHSGTLKKQTIAIPGGFDQWQGKGRIYYDFTDDKTFRDIRGFGHEYFSDSSGRNDFDEMRVAYDDKNLYFYVKTKDPITGYDGGSNWMNLLISVDQSAKSGFEGYQFIVNRAPQQNTTSIEKSTGGFNWSKVGDVKYEVAGNEMHIEIPKELLGIKGDKFAISFKWADNITKPDDIMNYYLTGDSAPIGRLGYLFEIN